jgi:GNAT superfamily N-acetyltransferase
MSALSFRLARVADAAQISALVNMAYRGDASRQGWTTEADLLDGLRTTTEQVVNIIKTPHSVQLLCLQNGVIVGSVCLEHQHETTHVGMFVVRPNLQGKGIGKQLLTYAEDYAKQHFNSNRLMMRVISQRHALIDFYHRRGYQSTGVDEDFPVNAEMWQPKVDGLKLVQLVKLT